MAAQAAADGDMDARIAQLQEILGKQISFASAQDSEEDDQNEKQGQQEQDEGHQAPESVQDSSSDEDAEATQPRDRGEEGQKPVAVDYGCDEFVKGQMVGAHVDFVSWKTVQAYPTSFIGKRNSPRARPYFAAIFGYKNWDFFQLYDPRHPEKPPHLLVPTIQFVEFLRFINHQLDTFLTIPPDANRGRFCIQFGQGGTPRPRYLFRCDCKSQFDAISWPEIDADDTMSFNRASQKYQSGFAYNIDAMKQQAYSANRKRNAHERALKRKVDRRNMMDMVQDHLGICNGMLVHRNSVFICIDIESLESSPGCVSEVGIAVLDMARIKVNSLQDGGSQLWPFIKAYHLRTKEYSGMRNYRYVHGCPESFDFGKSTFPEGANLSAAVMNILGPYLHNGPGYVLFVGHNVDSDIRYLSQIGIDIMGFPAVVGKVDTQDLHQVWFSPDRVKSLESVLADLGIFSSNLHNAGNDAVYTLRAMIALAVRPENQENAGWIGTSGDFWEGTVG
ncbi:hypothetical protein CDD81_5693 [Ophiocordyceps australis]|uniref:Gfd2/YDR514C-like C-terminal domain-containing protein n=1 Tax=Ophiocordyceps australis TaxID=1399860 RepID=A0A2C5Y9P3_9HYPO|nr:hypothetical protein CDD81_5693 [Ophiocordyceps australis]